MPRTKIPESLKESLRKGESIKRIYRRKDNHKGWTAIGWVVLDYQNNPVFCVTDSQVCEEIDYDEFVFTYSLEEGEKNF